MSGQRKIIHDDNNGLDYVLVGDYYIPMLALPEENRPIGYWGILWSGCGSVIISTTELPKSSSRN